MRAIKAEPTRSFATVTSNRRRCNFFLQTPTTRLWSVGIATTCHTAKNCRRNFTVITKAVSQPPHSKTANASWTAAASAARRRFPRLSFLPRRLFYPMPIYEFHCQKCGRDSEILVRSSDWKGTTCPHCGSKKLSKQLSTFASANAGGSDAPSGNGGGGHCCGGGCHCH